MVKTKSGDIAVLRALGAKDGLIRAIFVWYGLLAGLLGQLDWRGDRRCRFASAYRRINGIEKGDRASVFIPAISIYRLPAIRITLAGRCLRTGHGVVKHWRAGIRRGG